MNKKSKKKPPAVVHLKPVEDRKMLMREWIQQGVDKWQIAPDCQLEYTNHGIFGHVILVDLATGEDINTYQPTKEQQVQLDKSIEEQLKKSFDEKNPV